MPSGLRRVLREGKDQLFYASRDGLHPVDRQLGELLGDGLDELHAVVDGTGKPHFRG